MHECIVQILCQKFIKSFDFPYQEGNSVSSAGSGFFFDKSHLILTCAHVVEHAVSISIHIPNYGKRLFDANIVSVCPEYDIALLELVDSKSLILSHLEINGSGMKETKIGDTVEVKGYPLGQSNIKTTQGIISGQQYGFYQIDSPTNPGSSGGALLRKGKVIGIANAGVPFRNNVGYSIPIERFCNIYPCMLKKKIVHVPVVWGFLYQSLPLIDKEEKNGVLIVDVHPNTIASKFTTEPLQKGDILLKIGKYNVMTSCILDYKWLSENVDFQTFLLTLAIGSKIPFKIKRNNKEIRGKFTITEPDRKIRKLFFPHDQLEYCVFAGIVFVPLCMNILKQIKYYIRLDDKENGLDYEKKILENSTFASLLEALSISQRDNPRVIIFNQLPGSKIYNHTIFRTGDILRSCNKQRINTIHELAKFLSTKPPSYTFETDNGKSFTISSDGAEKENIVLNNKYQISVPIRYVKK